MKTNLTCEASSPAGTRLRMTATSLLDPFPAARLASRESLSRRTGRWRLSYSESRTESLCSLLSCCGSDKESPAASDRHGRFKSEQFCSDAERSRLSVAMSESERLGGMSRCPFEPKEYLISNQRDTRWIRYIKLHRVSNIAQKCIELQINIMPYALRSDRETMNPSPYKPYKGVAWL